MVKSCVSYLLYSKFWCNSYLYTWRSLVSSGAKPWSTRIRMAEQWARLPWKVLHTSSHLGWNMMHQKWCICKYRSRAGQCGLPLSGSVRVSCSSSCSGHRQEGRDREMGYLQGNWSPVAGIASTMISSAREDSKSYCTSVQWIVDWKYSDFEWASVSLDTCMRWK